jgi:CRP/FNR family transcriptional regulator
VTGGGAPAGEADLLAGLEPAQAARATAGLPERRLAEGELFDIGDTDAVCCVLASGRLALEFTASEGRPRVVGLVEEGDLLVRPVQTWAAVGPRLRCRALGPSRLIEVDRRRLDEWLRVPAMAANVVRILAAQIAERELAVAILLEPSVERRLLLKLRQLALRFGRVTPRGVRLDLRLTHQELATMVGAVRESVTLAMGRLAEQGEIEVRNRTVLIRGDLGAVRPPDPGTP